MKVYSVLFIFSLFLFSMLYTPSVEAIFSSREDWVVGVVEHTDSCLFWQCHTTYQVHNPNLILNAKLSDLISVEFNDQGSNAEQIPFRWEEEKVETYQEPIFAKMNYSNLQVRANYPNGTANRIITRSVNRTIIGYVSKTRKVWVPLDLERELSPGETINITVRGFVRGGQNIDNIISVDTGLQRFRYSEYAWFNAAWANKISANVTTDVLASLNSTIMVLSNGSFNTIPYCANSNCNDFILTNLTENEQLSLEFSNSSFINSTQAVIYVCLDTVAPASPISHYIYYTNAGASARTNTLAGCSNYIGVWHFDAKTNSSDTVESIRGIDNVTLEGGAAIMYSPNGDPWVLGALNPRTGTGYGQVQDSARLDVGNFTIEAWIKTSTIAAGNRGIVGRQEGTSSWNMYQSGPAFHCAITTSGAVEIDVGAEILHTGALQHVACTYNGTLAAWVDGNIIASQDVGATIRDTNSPLDFGCYDPPACTTEFDGSIDEVRYSTIARDAYYFKSQFRTFNITGSSTNLQVSNPQIDSVGIIPQFPNSSSSLVGKGITGFANYTEFRGANGTVYFVWAKNNIINYSLMRGVPATVSYHNVSTIVNYTLPIAKNDIITLMVNATNGTSYTGFSNASVTVEAFIPTTPTIQLPANNSIFYNTFNKTLVCNGSTIRDSNTLFYEFYVNETNPIPLDSPIQNSTRTILNMTGLQASKKYYWTCRALDGVGSVGNFANNMSFTMNNTFLIATTINKPSGIQELTQFNVSLTFVYQNNSVRDTNLTIRFNNTLYAYTSKTQLANDTVRYTSLLTAPAIESVNITKSFAWNLSLSLFNGSTNYTVANTTLTYFQIGFGLCNSTYSFPTLNITIHYESNYSLMDNTTQAATFVLYNESVGFNRTYSFNRTASSGIFAYDYCLSYDNTQILTQSIFETRKNGFVSREYWLNNYHLSSSFQNVDAYLLENTLSTPTTIKVQDQYSLGIDNAYISVQKYDISSNTYKTVQIVRTNEQGQALVQINFYDTFYRFIITIDGTTRLISELSRYSTDNTPITFTITPETVFVHDKFLHVDTQLSFNNVTKVYTLTYNNPSGKEMQVCLRASRYSLLPNASLSLCDTCSSQATGTLTCSMAQYGEGTFVAVAYAKGSNYFFQALSNIVANTINPIRKLDGSILTVILAGTLAVFGILVNGPAGAILFFIGGMIASIAFGLRDFDLVAFIGLVVIGGLFLWKLKD